MWHKILWDKKQWVHCIFLRFLFNLQNIKENLTTEKKLSKENWYCTIFHWCFGSKGHNCGEKNSECIFVMSRWNGPKKIFLWHSAKNSEKNCGKLFSCNNGFWIVDYYFSSCVKDFVERIFLTCYFFKIGNFIKILEHSVIWRFYLSVSFTLKWPW